MLTVYRLARMRSRVRLRGAPHRRSSSGRPPRTETEGWAQNIGDTASQVEKRIMAGLRMQSQSNFRRGGAVAGLLFLGGWMFWPEMKEQSSKEIAQVAGGALEDEEVQLKAEKLANSVVQTVLNDPAVRQAVLALTRQTLAHTDTQNSAARLATGVLQSTLEDPGTARLAVRLAKQVLQDPESKAVLLVLLTQLMKEEQVRQSLTALMNGVVTDQSFKDSSADLAVWMSHEVLDDVTVFNHSKEFVTAVLSDYEVQQTASEAMWNSVKYIFSPGWLSAHSAEADVPDGIARGGDIHAGQGLATEPVRDGDGPIAKSSSVMETGAIEANRNADSGKQPTSEPLESQPRGSAACKTAAPGDRAGQVFLLEIADPFIDEVALSVT